MSLERLGNFLSARGQPGDADQALAYYRRALEVRERLLAANPDSAQAARDVVVSHFKLAGFGTRTGDESLADRHARACLAVLRRYVAAGVTFDPPIMGLYAQLREAFGDGD